MRSRTLIFNIHCSSLVILHCDVGVSWSSSVDVWSVEARIPLSSVKGSVIQGNVFTLGHCMHQTPVELSGSQFANPFQFLDHGPVIE